MKPERGLPFIVVLVGAVFSAENHHHIFHTPSGKVRGRVENVPNGYEVINVLGLPFGEPPVGELRFKAPKMVQPWNGTFEADTLANACIQGKDTTYPGFWGAEMWNANTAMSEDCLRMNIWIPKNAKNATVMVWLFGGGFWYGSSSLALYDGRGLAAKGNVIVVNPNYRLGAFGFLFLDHPDVPGNVGLLDQQLALKWIRRNIASFGGNPDSVCLFGESAGAASIVAHMVAPSSEHLFKNGILQSGSLDNPWAMDTPQKAFNKSMQFVIAVGCQNHSMDSTVKCLRKLPDNVINDKLWDIKTGFLEFPLVVVSKDKAGFFDEDAFQALRLGHYRKTDLLIGVNSDEGTFWMVYYLKQYFNPTNESASLITETDFVDCVNTAFASLPVHMRKGIERQYWDTKCSKSSTFYRDAVNQIVGDYFFTCDSLWLADDMATRDKGQVYIYHFQQRSTNNPWPLWMGVMHAYEIEYVFGLPLLFQKNYSNTEPNFSYDVIRYWKSFAENSKPRLTYKDHVWPSYTLTDRSSFVLKANDDQPQEVLHKLKYEECQLWRSIRDIEYESYMNLLNKGGGMYDRIGDTSDSPDSDTNSESSLLNSADKSDNDSHTSGDESVSVRSSNSQTSSTPSTLSQKSIPKRDGSPSFKERRRITSARKKPIPYERKSNGEERKPPSFTSSDADSTRSTTPDSPFIRRTLKEHGHS